MQIGDELILRGKLLPFSKSKNAFVFDYSLFQKRNYKIHQIYQPEIIKVIRNKYWLNTLKSKIIEKLEELKLENSSKSVLYAMLLGDKSKISSLDKIFRNTGTSHVLAISGLHVGIIAAILNSLLSFFKRRWSWLKYLSIILGSWIFCGLSGAAPSTIRACVMVTCYFIAKLIGEKANGFNFCFIAAYFMLILDPNKIYNIGFQFSFLAILGILLLYKPLSKAFILRGIKEKIWQMSSLTLAAQIMITPLSIYYFHEFPLLFLPASLIAVPLTFVIIATALLSLVLSFLIYEFIWLSDILNWLITTFIGLLELLSNIEGTVLTNLSPSSLELVLYYSILAFLISNY